MTTQFHTSHNPKLPTPEEYSRRLEEAPTTRSRPGFGLTLALTVGTLLYLALLVTFPGIGLAVIAVGGPSALLGLFWWSEKRQNRE